MNSASRLTASVFAVALVLFVGPINAQKDKPAEKTAASEKSSEPAASDVTTQGEVDAGGQHIAYNAIAGIVTVGATDV